jgi:import inner membrane translocase subunit TIM13
MDSETVKNEVIRGVRSQFAMDNAKHLIEKINEHCFERCIPKPGTSVSSGEKTCYTNCVDKYIAGWNHINATYVARIQRES